VHERIASAGLATIAVLSVGMIIVGNAALAAQADQEKGSTPASDVRVVSFRD
jgi:hypothetical protein